MTKILLAFFMLMVVIILGNYLFFFWQDKRRKWNAEDRLQLEEARKNALKDFEQSNLALDDFLMSTQTGRMQSKVPNIGGIPQKGID
jgi:hypothetical protein